MGTLKITAEQVNTILLCPRNKPLWLTQDSDGVWETTMAGGVDGTEKHVLTGAAVWSLTVWREEGQTQSSDSKATATKLNRLFN